MSVSVLAVIPCVRLREAPILLLIHFHNALRQELAYLRRIAAEALESRIYGPELIRELRRRFEFFKLVNKYHSVAEDEVIFRALDAHVKNVVSAYTLEHTSTSDILDSIFHYLDVLKKEDADDQKHISKPFQELVYFIDTLQTSICKHMAKEEEQVFPLLTQQFSTQEQASFVWQFICSVPMLLLEDFFRWMNSFLSSDERESVLQCIKQVVPKDLLLQEVVISCIQATEQTITEEFNRYGKGSLFLNDRATFWKILEVYTSEGHSGEAMKPDHESPIHSTAHRNPLDNAHLWHSAYHKDLLDAADDLYSIRDSNDLSRLAPAVVQLKFFADVIVFYCNSLDKLLYSMCIELAEDCPAPSYQRFLDDSQIEGLQLLLYSKSENDTSARNFVENLCDKLKLSVTGIRKYLTFVETEVFPFIVVKCSHEMQQWLLYTGLEMMPLGLLKCTVTWFSSHLTEDDSRTILHSIKQGGVNKSLSSLLYEWVRIGYLGKTSVEQFREELQAAFENRCSFLTEQIKNNSVFPYLQLDTQLGNRSNTPYSSGISFHIFFPQKLKMQTHSSTYSAENNAESSFRYLESKPVDHIFFFHKALRKGMEHLVSLSANLAENSALFTEFYQQFHLLRVLHKIHSDAEDEIAFPALEAKEIIQNSSHSYSIDHKMDIEYFNRISYVLGQISELYVDDLNGRMVMYGQLCVKLHGMCKCMNKVLSDHVNHEELELWPLFREHLSLKEQEKIIGCMLGRTRAEILQQMIPWLMASLTVEEQNALKSLWRKVTKNTMFDQWLGEWWEDMKSGDLPKVDKLTVSTQSTADTLELVSKYLPRGGNTLNSKMGNNKTTQAESFTENYKELQSSKDQTAHHCEACTEILTTNGQTDTTANSVPVLSQEELEATIRRVNCDQSLEPKKKSLIIQNLMMSRWINTQKKNQPDDNGLDKSQGVLGVCPSYRDSNKLVFGCQHYKRNCKLVSSCCNKLYTCRLCHDDATDHAMDRKATTLMMCMKCLIIQPIGPTCSTVSCNNLSMARYYCRICKLFDDERQIYHCPYCNLCRVGKGLGMDYFHCMNCNACMARSLLVHNCREKCLEENCPICHEYIFTSKNPVKSLPCGHIMHSSCFQEYTCISYTCPICSKSLGDMQVYFRMLDAMLAEEKIPDEYLGRTQDILCNDCEKKGTAPFHWLYHKCPRCGSYNTRLI